MYQVAKFQRLEFKGKQYQAGDTLPEEFAPYAADFSAVVVEVEPEVKPEPKAKAKK